MIILWTVVYFIVKWEALKSIPNEKFLFASIFAIFLGYIFTIWEGFYLEVIFNLIEHVMHMISAVFLVIWGFLWKKPFKVKNNDEY